MVNLSFAGAGFLGIYHLGAAEAFLNHGQKLLGPRWACAGASAGSMAAAVMITAPNRIKDSKEFIYDFAERVRREKFGAFSLGHEFMEILRKGIEEILPCNAHSLAADRLYVSITDLKCCKNHLISQFTSKEDLVTALLASSYIPVYAGVQPVDFRGKKRIDGGFSDALPTLRFLHERTITVCPFVGTQDVCPVHKGCCKAKVRLANMTVMVSMENIKRLNLAMFPPPTSGMKALCKEGYNDAMRFLEKWKWMS